MSHEIINHLKFFYGEHHNATSPCCRCLLDNRSRVLAVKQRGWVVDDGLLTQESTISGKQRKK